MTSPLFPQLSAETGWSDLAVGVTLPLRALRLLLTQRALAGWAAASGLVTTATLVALAWWWWPVTQGWAEALVQGESTFSHVGAFALGLVLYVACGSVSALTVPNLVLAPLSDPLSEATERACGDFESPAFSLSALVGGALLSLRHTVLRLVAFGLGALLLLPLHAVPLAGSVVWLLASWTWGAFWLAVEHVSSPAARHGARFSQVVGGLRKRAGLALGLGGALWLVLWVPVVNFFVMPVAVVAGTLAFRSLRAAGFLAPR